MLTWLRFLRSVMGGSGRGIDRKGRGGENGEDGWIMFRGEDGSLYLYCFQGFVGNRIEIRRGKW